MATLLLTVALQVGARVIDNLLEPDAKPNFGNLVDSTAFGSALCRIWGPENRIPGSVIDLGPILAHKQKNVLKEIFSPLLSGVLGTTKTWTASVVYFLADCQTRPCLGLKAIWANGAATFDADQTTPSVDSHGVQTFTGGFFGGFASSVVFYPGNFTQEPDPTFEALRGAGLVPAYRGSAYVVINDMNLTNFGNQLPNLNFYVEQAESISLAAVCLDICTACGLDPNTVSTSALGAQTVRGYQIGTTCSGAQAIQPLALAYDFDAAEVAGGLRFVPRGQPPQATVILDWFDGRAGGAIATPGKQPYSFTRADTTRLPDGASITYPDPARAWQSNVAGDHRSHGYSQNVLSTTLPIVMTEDEAIAVADRALWEPITAAQGFKGDSDDRLIWIEPSKTFAVQGPNATDTYRPKTVSRGANRVLSIEAVCERAITYQSPSLGQPAPAPANIVKIAGPVNPPVIAEAPLSLTGNAPTLWLAVSGGDGTTFDPNWTGCTVYVSSNDSDFYPIGTISSPGAVQGKLTAGLPAYAGSEPDTGHTLSVSTALSGNDPASVSAGDAARYTPLAYAGGEWLAFETATVTGSHAFALTTLYRGLYGTAAGARSTGDDFAVFDGAAFPFALPPSFVGIELYFRFVGPGEDLATATTYPYIPTGAFDFYQPAAGFGINDPGLYSATTALGTAIWSQDITFDDDDPGTTFLVLSAPTSDATYTLKNAALSVVGTITIPAGDNGPGRVVAWASSPYVHPKGTPMHVLPPDPVDPTFGGVSAQVTGRLLG